MNYSKFLIVTIVAFATYLIDQPKAIAATIPLPDIDIIIKSIATKQVVVTSTDKDGNFSVGVPEEKGEFAVFLNDQSREPLKVVAKKGVVSGRVVILTDGTKTQDPVPVKPKKTKTSKPLKSIKKATSTSVQ